MKKLTLFAAIIFAMASITSCKKDRTCTCTFTSTQTGSTGGTYVRTMTKVSKGDARANCMSDKRDYPADPGTTIGGVTYGAMPAYTTTSTCTLN